MALESSEELITVAICTYARHELLKSAVESSLHQTLDRNLFKVLIVDNSADRAAAKEFYSKVRFDPSVAVIWSHPPGLSLARNRAVAVCDTPFIAFLDDDAIPDPGWLSALLSGLQEDGRIAAVGGPIAPLLEREQPTWLTERHLAMFGVFQPYAHDCDLAPNEHLYGGNIAFKLVELREAGGFPEQLGRKGTMALLGNEEFRPQDVLREKGLRVRYLVAARIRHLMHQDRMRRGWMRSRMAWQSVSDQLQDPPRFNNDHSVGEIIRLAHKNPDVAAAARLFFAPASAEALDLQLDLIWHFFSLLLAEHRLGDTDFDQILKDMPVLQPVRTDAASLHFQDDADCATGAYAPSASGAARAPYLFVEGLPGHRNLYDLYGDLPGAQLLTYWFGDPENTAFEKDLAFISRSIGPGTKSLFFLTLDQPAYFRPHREAFFRFLAACPLPVYGILHVMPQVPEEIDAVQRLGKLAAAVCFLSKTMAEHACSVLKLSNSLYLPHHPPTILPFPTVLREPDALREGIGVLPYQTVFSVIGEARHGKGIDLLLKSLDYIPNDARGQMFFLFAGKATHHSAEEVRSALLASSTAGFVELRTNPHEYQHVVVTDREYAKFIGASDVALLLYQDEQRHRMSGVLPDFVWANCLALATENSYVGAEVERHGLGLVLRSEEPEALAGVLVEALRLAQQGHSKSKNFLKYRAEIAPQAVLQRLLAIIDPAAAEKLTHVETPAMAPLFKERSDGSPRGVRWPEGDGSTTEPDPHC